MTLLRKSMSLRVLVGVAWWLAVSACPAQPAPAALPDVPTLPLTAFFQQPVGPRGLAFADAVLAARGHTVRLLGHMVAQESPLPGRFLLAARPVRMSEHADGDADDLPAATVVVHLAPSQHDRLVAWRGGLMALTGRLEIGRVEEDDGRVSWARLVLPDDAVVDARPTAALP